MAGSSLDPARKLPVVFEPLPASLVELVVVWAWHTPALHHRFLTRVRSLVIVR
jgi:putative membrane protein